MIIRLFRLWMGYVRFRVKGPYPERLLNLLSKNNINIWNVNRHADSLEACISIRDYRRLPNLCKKAHFRIRNLERSGIFVFAAQHVNKLGFLVGLLVFTLLLHFLSGFIWQIQISGNETISQEEITAGLNTIGIKIGAPKKKIDSFNIHNQLMLAVEGISWASVNLEGSRATVLISESTVKQEAEDDAPCNLIASCDGIITDLRVTAGDTRVIVGQPVTEGELLVSGTIEYATGATGWKHAAGAIYANTTHLISSFIPYQYSFQRSGAVLEKSYLDFFGLKIPLYLGSVPFAEFSVSSLESTPLISSSVPFTKNSRVFYEQLQNQVLLSKEEAIDLARKNNVEIANIQLKNMTLFSYEESIFEQNDGIRVDYLYNCNENIAITKKLAITTIN